MAASWCLSDEWGMKYLRWLDNLEAVLQLRYRGQQQHPDRHGRPDAALRGRYGQSFIFGDPTYWTPNGNGASESFMANANLTWETTYSHNLGLDFGFWRNCLLGIGRGLPEHHRGYSHALSRLRFGLQLPVPQCRYDPQPRSGGVRFPPCSSRRPNTD
ncbi:MAG: hypothetical protein V8Q54_11320 [Alistipes senegalensis]